MKKLHSLSCPHSQCASQLVPTNGAVNFSNPALSVVLAVKQKIARPRQSILEFGSGNLRNAIYLQGSLPTARVYAYDLQPAVDRFPRQYKEFQSIGGIVIPRISHVQKYDIVICTFVVETICPARARINALITIRALLHSDGLLVASIRGHGGVRGSTYHICQSGDGLVSSHRTFIKPHSISEAKTLLRSAGYNQVGFLQEYRVDTPENIHLTAR